MIKSIKTILFLRTKLRRLYRAENSLKFVLSKASSKYKSNQDPFAKAFIVTGNRIFLDSKAVRILTLKGYYGSAFSLVAASLRTRTMVAALHVKPDLIGEFNNEEKWTHTDNRDFREKFNEGTLKKIVSDHFGEEYINKNSLKELEQILHGSSFALKRWYSRIEVVNGLRTPSFTFEPFFSLDVARLIFSTMESIDTELIGIFYEHYQKDNYPPHIICSCGSGKKYKDCHFKSLDRAASAGKP
jgi:hypothetical protein